MPLPAGLSAAERRQFMANTFSITQNEMSELTDQVVLTKRSAVPYPSTWKGQSIAYFGPVPADDHLVPSGNVVKLSDPVDFSALDEPHEILGLSGKPYASYRKVQPKIFEKQPDRLLFAKPSARKTRTTAEEEMWRAQFMEWTLQKNAYNPDIAAGMRTNVRKQASLTVPPIDKPQDPARTSENVKAALSHSEITGAALQHPKQKIAPSVYFPQAMA